MKRLLTELAGWLQAEGQLLDGVLVSGVSIDTRTLTEGDLFIPFRGEQVNGHKYVRQAIEKGAAASLWMKDEPDAPTDIPLIFVDDPELALQQLARTYREEACMQIHRYHRLERQDVDEGFDCERSFSVFQRARRRKAISIIN